jgi:hypothetical protein
MNGSNHSFGDPNDGRERVGERRKRERAVSLFLDHGCAGEGGGGGGGVGGGWGAGAAGRALGLGLLL